MELRHLRYFVAVAESLSFRRAADRLHLTRPALSKQIKEVEFELGVRLLDRTTARVALTPAGEVYLEEARAVLARVDQAAELAREAEAGQRGRLVIGEPGVLGATFLSPVLARFREKFPHVEISLRELPVHEHVHAVKAGEIQVGFATREQVAEHKTVDVLPVLQLRMGVAVPSEHPFARRRALTVPEIVGQPMICIGESGGSEHARYVREQLAKFGVTIPRGRIVSGIRSLVTMVASGHGLSLVPDRLTLTGNEMAIVPLAGGRAFQFELLALWRKGDESLLVQNFVHALRRFARQKVETAEEPATPQPG